jgi:hypothetical protein
MRRLVEFLRSDTCSFPARGKMLFAVVDTVRGERIGADRTLSFFDVLF